MTRLCTFILAIWLFSTTASAWTINCKADDIAISQPASNINFRVLDGVPKLTELQYGMRVSFDGDILALSVGGKSQEVQYFVSEQWLPTLKVHTSNYSDLGSSVGYFSIPINPDWERGDRGLTQYVASLHTVERGGVSVVAIVGKCENRE